MDLVRMITDERDFKEQAEYITAQLLDYMKVQVTQRLRGY